MNNDPATRKDCTTITVRKTINAPRERVFDAWLDADTVRQWWCAGCGTDQVTVDVDPRVGGTLRIDTHSDACGRCVDEGTFLEITRPSRLRFSWGGQHDDPTQAKMYDVEGSEVTIDFLGHGSRTEIVLTHAGLTKQTARDGTQQGWEMMVTAIEGVLTQSSAR